MRANKYDGMPTEDVPVTEIQKGDVILVPDEPPMRVLQKPIRQRRPRNQSTVLSTLPPANGAPVKPDHWFLQAKSVHTLALQGFVFDGPYLADDMVTRVVMS